MRACGDNRNMRKKKNKHDKRKQMKKKKKKLTRTALSRTTCETVSRNWAAIPGLFKPSVNFRSAISLFAFVFLSFYS